jgi:hypothetical protein
VSDQDQSKRVLGVIVFTVALCLPLTLVLSFFHAGIYALAGSWLIMQWTTPPVIVRVGIALIGVGLGKAALCYVILRAIMPTGTWGMSDWLLDVGMTVGWTVGLAANPQVGRLLDVSAGKDDSHPH